MRVAQRLASFRGMNPGRLEKRADLLRVELTVGDEDAA
jgi:hypothetical protein